MLKGITAHNTEFRHVVMSLLSSATDQCRDLIRKQPKDMSYEQIKDRLLKTYMLAGSKRPTTILDIHDLGDQQPTNLFNCIQLLDEDQTNQQYLLKEVFWHVLPREIYAHLADKLHMTLAEFAEEADRHFTTIGDLVCSMCKHNTAQPARKAMVATLCNPAVVQCFYHKRLGKEARKFYAPCKYRSEN